MPVNRLEALAARLEACVATLHALHACPDGDVKCENARLLALLRAHPPPRPAMLPQRRLRLAARQEWRCALCDALLTEAFHVDHKRPWSTSFDDTDANLQVVCVPCHLEKTSLEASARAPAKHAPR